jgi:hypothetical protein
MEDRSPLWNEVRELRQALDRRERVFDLLDRIPLVSSIAHVIGRVILAPREARLSNRIDEANIDEEYRSGFDDYGRPTWPGS